MVRCIARVLAGFVGGAGSASWGTKSYLQSKVECSKKETCTFSPDEYKPYRLISSQYESHDTRRFFFALDDANEEFHLPVASCAVLKFVDAQGDEVVRPYTPISVNGTKGHFELLVKRYPKGKMGSHLFTMQPGEEILVKGPFEKIAYRPNRWRRVGMIAGGTGITPMYQIIRAIVDNPKDKTLISLIYANTQRRDILLANELTELQKTSKNFNMYLTLLEVPRRWLGGIGYINSAMLTAFMPKPGEKDSMILICGPPPMLQAISGDKLFEAGKAPQQGPLTGLLSELGYTENQVFKF